VKRDTAGLGMKVKSTERTKEEADRKLNAKQVRLKEEEGKKKGERLREIFYCSEDVERYLRG
jgi:hypothetical protein